MATSMGACSARLEPCEYFVVHRQPEPFIGQLEVPTQEFERLHFVVKFDLLDRTEPWAAGSIDERLARSDDVLLFRCQVLKPLEIAVLVVELCDIREADATEFLEDVFSGEFELREEPGLLKANLSGNFSNLQQPMPLLASRMWGVAAAPRGLRRIEVDEVLPHEACLLRLPPFPPLFPISRTTVSPSVCRPQRQARRQSALRIRLQSVTRGSSGDATVANHFGRASTVMGCDGFTAISMSFLRENFYEKTWNR